MNKYFLTMVLLLFALTLSAQIKVSGKITDTNNNPLPGANVLIKGSTIGVSSDFDGNYTIEAKQGDVLEFSFVGFQNQTKKVVGGGNSLIINIILNEDTQKLDDVVVVGYGTQKKANLTGTVNSVKTETIQNRATTSITNALQGVAPGVTVISRPGDVGGDMGSVNVRGRGNLGTSSPLYVVDGVIVGAGEFQRIHPGDIESISILKDAAASAIYGARAAFGVFLVTTKKGKEGKTSINYNGYYGFQSPTVLPNVLNSQDYVTLINEASTNAGKGIVYDQDVLDRIIAQDSPDLYPNNNWYKMVYRAQTPIQEHNISISGGGKTRYFVSGTFYQQESLVKGRVLDRYSFRANTERDFTDKLTLGTNISYIRDDFSRDGDFSTTDLARMLPVTVARHTDGTWGTITAGKEDAVLAQNNPLRKIAEDGRKSSVKTHLNTSLKGIWKPLEGLHITGQISYRAIDSRESTFENRINPAIGFISKKPMKGTDSPINKLENIWKHNTHLSSQLFATYDFSLGKNDFSLMVGTQFEDYKNEELKASRKDFQNNNLNAINAGSEKAENLGNGGNITESALLSQFGRFKYAYNNRYLFEANIRADQSSQFPKKNRLGIFPSFSGAYRISEENFLKDIDWLSNLKLRASWGQLGNVSNVGLYGYYDILSINGSYIYNGVKVDGVAPSIQVNKDFTWETVTMSNLGIDASFFRNALTIQVDVFDKLTTDILLRKPQPLELGLIVNRKVNQQASSNAGVVSNKGIEAMVSYSGNIGEVKYNVSGNISKIWNKVIDLNGQDNQIDGNFITKEGGSIGDFYGYQTDGLFTEEEIKTYPKISKSAKAGDIKYVDLNGDGKITPDDRTILGNDVPYFTYALGFDLSYKGFDFSVQGQGVKDVLLYLTGENAQAFFNGANAKQFHMGRWTQENPNKYAPYPRALLTADNKHNTENSSFWLIDADYFRVKTITLGYTMPENIVNHLRVQKLRFYLSGSNLLTFKADDRVRDIDPEAPSGRGQFPNMKNIIFGINISL